MKKCSTRLVSSFLRGSSVVPKSFFCTAAPGASATGKNESSNFSENPETYRVKLLEQALTYVPEHGWSDECLALAAKDLNLPATSHRIVRRGSPELVEYFMDKKRRHVHHFVTSTPLHNIPNEDFNEFQLRLAIEEHFKFISPYKKHWSDAVAITLDPSEIPYTMKSMYSLVDDLCHLAEIKASRLDWYSERALLFYVYGTTELFYLTDETEGFLDTQ